MLKSSLFNCPPFHISKRPTLFQGNYSHIYLYHYITRQSLSHCTLFRKVRYNVRSFKSRLHRLSDCDLLQSLTNLYLLANYHFQVLIIFKELYLKKHLEYKQERTVFR